MRIIDSYAYANRIHDVDPVHKSGLALVALTLCLISNDPLVGLITVAWMWGLSIWVAGLPAAVFGRILMAEGAFLMLTTLGVAVSVNTRAPLMADWVWQVGAIHISSSADSLALAVRLLMRALGGAAALNLLALTTPLTDIVALLRRLRVPELLIDTMTVMYRFIFVLLDSLDQMWTAQQSRLGYSSLRNGIQSAGLLASQLFIDALRRSRKLQQSLESRGYEQSLRVLPSTYRRTPVVWLATLAVVSSQLAVWIAL